MKQEPDVKAAHTPPNLVVLATVRPDAAPPRPAAVCARQRLEDQFRQSFREQHARDDLGTALGLGAEPAATANGRTT